MQVRAKKISIPRLYELPLIQHFESHCRDQCADGEIPLRFIVTKTDEEFFHCELDVLQTEQAPRAGASDIFDFQPRPFPREKDFTAVFLLPTGIAAQLGGHAGDANALVRYMGSCCDTLITHPNAVNASDINEMPANGLYVEGSVISRLMMGTCALRPVRANRILLLMDQHEHPLVQAQVINAASAARCTLGAEVDVVAIKDKPLLNAFYGESGRAMGEIVNLDPIFRFIASHKEKYDAVAFASVVHFPEEIHRNYIAADGDLVNPWGGVEAMLTHAASLRFNLPSAHAPMMADYQTAAELSDVIDPRMAAEEISCAFLHCVLKGLQKAPQIITDPRYFAIEGIISNMDLNCLVIPDGCIGLPMLAAMAQQIPVIAVKENRTIMKNDLDDYPFSDGKLIRVDNYLEAGGVMQALRSGVSLESLRRPITYTSFATH